MSQTHNFQKYMYSRPGLEFTKGTFSVIKHHLLIEIVFVCILGSSAGHCSIPYFFLTLFTNKIMYWMRFLIYFFLYKQLPNIGQQLEKKTSTYCYYAWYIPMNRLNFIIVFACSHFNIVIFYTKHFQFFGKFEKLRRFQVKFSKCWYCFMKGA